MAEVIALTNSYEITSIRGLLHTLQTPGAASLFHKIKIADTADNLHKSGVVDVFAPHGRPRRFTPKSPCLPLQVKFTGLLTSHQQLSPIMPAADNGGNQLQAPAPPFQQAAGYLLNPQQQHEEAQSSSHSIPLFDHDGLEYVPRKSIFEVFTSLSISYQSDAKIYQYSVLLLIPTTEASAAAASSPEKIRATTTSTRRREHLYNAVMPTTTFRYAAFSSSWAVVLQTIELPSKSLSALSHYGPLLEYEQSTKPSCCVTHITGTDKSTCTDKVWVQIRSTSTSTPSSLCLLNFLLNKMRQFDVFDILSFGGTEYTLAHVADCTNGPANTQYLDVSLDGTQYVGLKPKKYPIGTFTNELESTSPVTFISRYMFVEHVPLGPAGYDMEAGINFGIAGALVSLRCYPHDPSPSIRAMMDSVRRKRTLNYSKVSPTPLFDPKDFTPCCHCPIYEYIGIRAWTTPDKGGRPGVSV